MLPTLKSFAHWLVYAGLVVVAAALILLGKVDAVLVERFRMQVSDPVAPLLDVLSRPADVAADGLDRARRWIDVAGENDRLRSERDELLRWRAAAKQLEAENAGLRRLLGYVPEPDATYRSARVIADSAGVFAQSVMISAGSLAGIDKGQIVLDGRGLVGRVVGVSARVGRGSAGYCRCRSCPVGGGPCGRPGPAHPALAGRCFGSQPVLRAAAAHGSECWLTGFAPAAGALRAR